MSHFIKRCDLCNIVISQCRCFSFDKPVTFETCSSCQVLVNSLTEAIKQNVDKEIIKKTIREATEQHEQ